jgi:hypothetical protein
MLFQKPKNKNIYWKIHTAGLINQVMSIETGAGIAFMEKAPICFYKTRVDKNRTVSPSGIIPEKRKRLYSGSSMPIIFDLLDIPNDIFYSVINQNDISSEIKIKCLELNDILGFYYKCQDGPHETEFAEGRNLVPSVNNSSVNFVKFTFAFYSRFFFNRPPALDSFLSRLTFKKEYLDLAEKIAKKLGKFRGMHIRLTDHANKYDTTPENIANGQKYFINTNLPLIVSTDDKNRVSDKIKIKCIFVDDIINDEFDKEFMRLPFHNEIVFGLISLLIMSYSEEFVGTPGSTFSSYIHRLIINRGLKNNLNYIKAGKPFDNYKQNGPFSWNGFEMHTNTKNWWREWEECKLCVTKS